MTRPFIPIIRKAVEPVADVCLIVEGCYPYIRGGVSSWVDWLLRSQFDLSFQIVSIWPKPLDLEPQYALPANVLNHSHLYLYETARSRAYRLRPSIDDDAVAAALLAFLDNGDLPSLSRLMDWAERLPDPLPKRTLWRVVERMYEMRMPQAAFLDFFWAWRSLFGGLFATLHSPLPKARV